MPADTKIEEADWARVTIAADNLETATELITKDLQIEFGLVLEKTTEIPEGTRANPRKVEVRMGKGLGGGTFVREISQEVFRAVAAELSNDPFHQI